MPFNGSNLESLFWPDVDQGRQPQGTYSLSSTNQLAQGLTLCIEANGDLLNPVSNLQETNVGAFPYSVQTWGKAASLNGSSQYISVPTADFTPPATGDWSYACTVFINIGAVGVQELFGAWDNASGGRNVVFYGNLPHYTEFDIPYKQAVIVGPATPQGVPVRYLVTKVGTTITIYTNGVYSGSGTLTTTLETPTTAMQWGNGGAGITSPINGSIGTIRAWNRGLSAQEALLEYNNPWQVFAPPIQNLYFSSSSGGGAVSLAGAAAAVSTASGTLTEAVALAGSSVEVSIANATSSVAVHLAGASIEVSTATGSLQQNIPLSGTSAAISSANGTFSIGVAMTGAAIEQAIAQAAMTQPEVLAGSAIEVSLAQATMAIQVALSGSAIETAIATGNLTAVGSGGLSGTAAAISAATGTLSIAVPLAGTAHAIATAIGNLSVSGSSVNLAGPAVSVSVANGQLSLGIVLSGAAIAQSIAQGGLAIQVPLSGEAAAFGFAQGTLSGVGTEVIPCIMIVNDFALCSMELNDSAICSMTVGDSA